MFISTDHKYMLDVLYTTNSVSNKDEYILLQQRQSSTHHLSHNTDKVASDDDKSANNTNPRSQMDMSSRTDYVMARNIWWDSNIAA